MTHVDLYSLEEGGSQIEWEPAPAGGTVQAVERAVLEVAQHKARGRKGPFELVRTKGRTHRRTRTPIRGDETREEQAEIAGDL